MKKLASLLLAFILLLSCTAAFAQSEEKLKVGLTTFSLAVTWNNQNVTNTQTYCNNKYGDSIEFTVFNANNKIADQVTHIENMINDGYDIILIDSTTPTGVSAALTKARENGIIVVNYNSGIDDENAYDCKLSVDQYNWGAVLAQGLVDVLGGKGKIVMLHGVTGNKMSDTRSQGALDVFAQYPEIEILAEAYGEREQAPAEAAMTAWIAAFPEIDGAWVSGGASTNGVLNVLLNNGMDLIPVTSEDFNGTLKIWYEHMLSEGYQSVASGVATKYGCLALEAALRIKEGKELEKTYSLELPIITNENLEKYVRPDMPDDYWTMTDLVLAEMDEIWPDYAQYDQYA